MTEELAGKRCHALALWLQEAAGRRPVRMPPPGTAPSVIIERGLASRHDAAALVQILRRLGLLSLVLVTGLQYIYMDTLLEIQLLRPLIVFVLTRGTSA